MDTVVNSATSLSSENDIRSPEDLLMKMAWFEYRRFCRALNDHNLTPSQFHTLIAIKECGQACTMGHLAGETNQVSATMTGIIDRLVDRGWVERWRNPQDRRAVLVRLTNEGKAKLDSVYQARKSVLAQSLNKLDESSRHHLFFSLKQYLEILNSLSD